MAALTSTPWSDRSRHSGVSILIVLGLVLAAVAPRPAGGRPAQVSGAVALAPTTLTFGAEADARVAEAYPTGKYGTSTYLRADGGSDPDVEGYLRFSVSGASAGAQSAKLRLYAYNGTVDGPAVYATGNAWTETTVTWGTRPERTGAAIADVAAIGTKVWVEYDVTALVAGDGTYSFALATPSTDGVDFYSRESATNKPQLVVTTGSGATAPTPTNTPLPTPTATPATAATTLTLAPEADARVQESMATTNYGTATALRVDGGADPDVESYLRFTVSGVSGTVQGAKLRLYAYSGTVDGPAVYGAGDAWTETGITWGSRPARTGAAVDDRAAIGANAWVEWDVTRLVTGDGAYTFDLATTSTDGVDFYSRENATNKPQLVISVASGSTVPTPTPSPTDTPTPPPTDTPTPLPPSESDPVLVAAGDIASCTSLGDEATASLLSGIAGTVATLGDNAYDAGTDAEFANCYGPSWGQHKARTRPAAGNHEYSTSGATGYYKYFGAAAGDPAKGYYSYTLGSWHIVVVNSNCTAAGGCDAGSPQEQWLRGDLAANPSTCTLAYWHHPRFSSGEHGDAVKMQPIWQALYDAGADVVLSGHDHTYERFAPQDPVGNADPARGIREFVVGTGGRSHDSFLAVRPNSEVRNADTWGVLKLTLRATGYDWTFVPETGKTFTDSGSGACH